MINFQTSPEQYKHWKLSFDGGVATLSMDVQEDETLAEGYKLKLNSYDLGVDIELADAIQRIRFEHPEVRAVVITSLKPRMFCAGANIYMLGTSSRLHGGASVLVNGAVFKTVSETARAVSGRFDSYTPPPTTII